MLPCAPMLSALSHWLGSCNYATGSGRHAAADKQNEIPEASASGIAGGSDRRRSGDLSIFSRTLYQLSYRAKT